MRRRKLWMTFPLYKLFTLKIFRWLRKHDDPGFISAGSIEICRAKMSLEVVRKGETLLLSVDGKLDTCGSVSLAHFLLHERHSPV